MPLVQTNPNTGEIDTAYVSFSAHDPAQPCNGGTLTVNKDKACTQEEVSFAFTADMVGTCVAFNGNGPGGSAKWTCSTGGSDNTSLAAIGIVVTVALLVAGMLLLLRSRRARSARKPLRAGLLNGQVHGGGSAAAAAPAMAQQAYAPPHVHSGRSYDTVYG